jgi:hypothetical protein
MSLVDNVSITRNQVYKGSGVLAIGSLASFPGELESVINPTTYVLGSGIAAYVPTSEDGVTLNRTAEVSDGIAIDQRKSNLDEGEPEAWSMGLGTTLLRTDAAMLKIAWELGTVEPLVGSVVSQTVTPISAPSTFTEQELYLIQEDAKTGRLRVFAFRKAVPQPDGDLNAQSEEASGLPVTFKLREDTSVAAHHGSYGKIFEEDAS